MGKRILNTDSKAAVQQGTGQVVAAMDKLREALESSAATQEQYSFWMLVLAFVLTGLGIMELVMLVLT